eukprot:TRINITY_DN719_c2_g1_i1.p1 TRINITY_DN719_c2_g1~~TRINITY_DN719_c2_g1_i1.p1  ORF type:complete len:158 (+),score=3.64 TRINITY_DN719_c2_g1_i1:86-559(+)
MNKKVKYPRPPPLSSIQEKLARFLSKKNKEEKGKKSKIRELLSIFPTTAARDIFTWQLIPCDVSGRVEEGTTLWKKRKQKKKSLKSRRIPPLFILISISEKTWHILLGNLPSAELSLTPLFLTSPHSFLSFSGFPVPTQQYCSGLCLRTHRVHSFSV